MGISLPDLILECTIRDGIEYLKANPLVLQDIFSPLLSMYASRKYGQAEIDRINSVLQTKTIAVVHSFHEAEAKSPCYSIQLGSEGEAKERARINDFEADEQDTLTGSALLPYVKISSLTPTAYDPLTGKVSVSDSADMSIVNHKYIFTDGADVEFEIQRGFSNVPGNKFFFILKQQVVDIVHPGSIKSFINYSQHEVKSYTSQVNVLVGVHSKDALLTKYLYVILKYIMASRKHDLIQRGMLNSSFQGSDFTRDLRYEGDMVFTRFFTVSGQIDDSWRSDNVDLVDAVQLNLQPVDFGEETSGDDESIPED